MDRRSPAVLLAACLALTACGGGGGIDVTPGAGPTPTPTPTPTPSPPPGGRAADVSNISIGESSSAAAAAVATVNAAVADVQAAGAGPGGVPGGALTLPLPAGATLTGTINCGLSGSYTYTYNYNGTTGVPINYTFDYRNCRYGTATNYFEYNGSANLNYENYTSATDYRWTLTYDLTYAYVSPSYNTSGSYSYSQVCQNVAGQLNCSYQVGGNGVSNSQVSTSGSVTTITRATVRSGSITVNYSNWVYDATLGRATSGSVVITGSNGNQITIEVTGTGYRVTIVFNGRTSVYTVSF